MKRGLLGFPLLVLLTQVVSAQFFSGYGGFSITNFFDSIDSATITLGLLFFIFFALIFYALSRVFKDQYGQPNKGIAGTIALAVSLLIIYGIYRSGFNLGDLFYGFGIGKSALYLIALIIFIVLAIFLIKKIKLHGFLIVFGLLLILLTIFTDIFYEKLTALIIGIVLLLIGLFLWWRKRKRKRKLTEYGDYGPSPRGPGMFSRRREKRREFKDIRHEQKMDYERQRTEKGDQRKLHEEEEKQRRRQEEEQRRQEERQRKEMKKQGRQQQQELTERQQKREKGRKAGLRQINQQVKVIDRQLRNHNISEHSKRVLRQRMEDLENRRRTLKKYGIGKGNI